MLLRFLADHQNPDSLAARMRRKRMAPLKRLLSGFPTPARVLDVGGEEGYWKVVRSELPAIHLTLLNRSERPGATMSDTEVVLGDARSLGYDTGSFDVCFSNSVIEHVGDFEDQRAMANEVRRVGKSYFVQTPYKYFPIEPHFHVPAWQFLPLELRIRLHQRFDLGWVKRDPDRESARAYVEHIRLLAAREYQSLFPDARVHYERVGPLIKSMIAVRGE